MAVDEKRFEDHRSECIGYRSSVSLWIERHEERHRTEMVQRRTAQRNTIILFTVLALEVLTNVALQVWR